MKRIYTLSIFGMIILLCFTKGYGQVTIDAEIRPRSEYRSGFNQPLPDTVKSAAFTLQRTRLNFNYITGLINVRLVLQDSRIFGEADTKQPSTATNGSMGIYEAWAELLILQGTTFKIGRQGIQFEDGRLFSLSPWSNTGNSHDLIQLKYATSGFDTQFGFAFNNQKAYNADTSFYSISKMYKQLVFLHLTKTISEKLLLSLLAIEEGFMSNKTDLDLYHRYTTGGTLQLKKDKLPFSFFATMYYQFGKSTPTVNLDAWLLALKANYNFTDKIGGLAGIDYYSGSESTIETTKTKTFNKLPYGVNHSFNGYMEYWAALPKGGLTNYYGGMNMQLSKKISSDITYYAYSLSKSMMVSTNKVQKNIGSELDLVMNYKFSPETTIQLAWCGYFVTDGTRMLKYKSVNAETKFPQYAYLMLTIKPQFYKTPACADSKN